jgi:hypothetical protein
LTPGPFCVPAVAGPSMRCKLALLLAALVAPVDVKTVWHGILRSTLKGDDLKKLGPDD